MIREKPTLERSDEGLLLGYTGICATRYSRLRTSCRDVMEMGWNGKERKDRTS